MNDSCIETELEWLDEKFVKSMGRIHYLCLIEKGCSHGYDMLQYMKSHFKLKLSAAAVYPVLQALEDDGHITGVWVEGKYPKRKKYTLTPKGRRLLTAARTRIYCLVAELIKKSSRTGHGRN